MSIREMTLDRCLQQLITQGKKYGGYITYQAVINTLQARQLDASMEVLDLVYERLSTGGIELVDQLPDVPRPGVDVKWRDAGETLQDHQGRSATAPPRQLSGARGLNHDTVAEDLYPCPEEMIDALLSHVDEAGLLRREDFLTMVEESNLTALEVDQLVEYLGLRGIDLSGPVWPQSLRLITVDKDYGIDEMEEEAPMRDPGVQALWRDINRLERLPARDERELARRAEEGDRAARRRLIEANLRHLFALADHYVGSGLDFLDLFQEGFWGLLKATERFDWRRGFRLSTYSSWWIYQTMSRAIADHSRIIRLPVHISDELTRLQKIKENLCYLFGREPTAAEIAAEVNVPERRVCELQALARPVLSWDAMLAEWDEAEINQEAFMRDCMVPPADEDPNGAWLREAVAEVLASLKPREQEVLRLRFGLDGNDPQTLEEVGQRFGLTRERIRQIEAKALKRLRHPSRSRRLRDFLG